VSERDREKFHSSKNLAMMLIGGPTKSTNHSQWLNETKSKHLSAAKKRGS
jgi:gluconate kinase